jgi:putative transposase
MATDPRKSLAPKSIPSAAKNGLPSFSESDLADLSLRELLGMLLSSVGVAERKAYLDRLLQDKPNGFYDRSLQLGTMPLEVRVPRTRSGDFRPASLPALYQRGYSDETQSLLLSLLSSGRSLNAVKDALQKMGLSSSQQDLETVATGLIEELDLRNSRPLDPDLLVLFLDGKYVEFRDQDRLRPACIYVVIGLRRDGKKQVLTCLPRAGRENLEDWKFVLRSLLERGLRRALLLVQDDFSGLLPITQSLFPNTDIQLCTVHMQRNAKTHLSKADAAEFQQRWRAIKSSWTLEVANQQFEQLCDRFAKNSPAFVAEIRKKRQHYLAFISYPEAIRRSLSTTNVVEAINGQLEIMRRNSGGYFHSEQILKLKLGLAVSSLEQGRWKSLARNIAAVLHQFNALFQSRFETAA